MRRASNVDTVQPQIVSELRDCGVKVAHLHTSGSGIPDLLCGYRGRNILLEVKTGKEQLNKMQRDWHASWTGQVAVVRSFDEAMNAILKACE